MRAILLILSALPVLGLSGQINEWKPQHPRFHSRGYSARSAGKVQVNVPTYNFSMPVDHFNSANKDFYPNRYFVNDTYYRPGGPVILYDNGEAGFETTGVAEMLAEARGPSLPMQLAANLSALVIGWEHRYYGYSRPVPMDDDSGMPVEGVKGYAYLSVDQALEDVAYFANKFNSTTLDKNTFVKTTAGLDPYSTPWIFVGASYAGSRAALMRLRHPEIIYASWASSAPVQFQSDGSPYYDPMMRSMPVNCTNDIKAAIKHIDNALDSGSAGAVARVKLGALLSASTELGAPDVTKVGNISDWDTAARFASGIDLRGAFQSYGAVHTTQVMCDAMESFNVKDFAKVLAATSQNANEWGLVLNNTGGSPPTAKGIAISNGDNGAEYAFAALVYGIVSARVSFKNFTGDSTDYQVTGAVDNMSWCWQTLSEVGIFVGSDPNNITVVSRWHNTTTVRDVLYKQDQFGMVDESELPQSLNNSGLLKMGGWSMTASNVMFTNGEFDPWRAFSVASQVEMAPKRNVVQTVPKCNEISPQGDVFGLTYLGAVHAEDMTQDSFSTATLVGGKSPQKQGLQLFLEAWNVWAPCFNQSRNSIRNGKGVDGNGHDASGNSTTSSSTNAKSGKENSGIAGFVPSISGVSTVTFLATLFTILY
ncbi:hypothetical protein NQ176_g3502 [Zarea fungicola]|uniref:Uncharacterized protein n=1 Tax=Zarea fungicola TaxID=93591 RepID=A0ACC1NKX5_9HYPO|nr:hypothetical protein NQ176_g3502 [Lecanicillium fungicola]